MYMYMYGQVRPLLDLGMLYNWTTGIMSFVIAVGGAYAVVNRLYRRVHRDDDTRDKLLAEHDKKITKQEKEIAEIKEKLLEDYKRLKNNEKVNQITLEALFGLIGHALDGNNIAELEKVQKDLKDFLIKGGEKDDE